MANQKLSTEEREEKMQRAYDLSFRGMRAAQIGRALGVSEKTVDTWLKVMRQRMAPVNEERARTALETYLGEQDAVIQEGWRRLASTRDQSLNISALLSTISTASDRKGKAQGLLKERLDVTSGDEKVIFTLKIDGGHGAA